MLSELDEEDDFRNQPIERHKVPPINQRRVLAFVNHFVAETVDFLTRLITDCDLKFLAFETKLRKIEDSLLILEAKLSSVPELREIREKRTLPTREETVTEIKREVPETVATTISMDQQRADTPIVEETIPKTDIPNPHPAIEGVKACEDYRYKKFFKMIHFGVPAQHVKIKVATEEGLDADILDTPNQILIDGRRIPPQTSDNEEDEDDESS